MRSVTPGALQSMFAQETAAVFCGAIVVEHQDLPSPMFFVSNSQNVAFNGDTYLAVPFQLILSPDTEASPPQAKVILDNVERQLVSAVRALQEPPSMELSVFRIDAANLVTRELGPMPFHVLSVTADAQTMEFTLGYNFDLLNEPAMKLRFTPQLAPGLF
jgi:hypothetical protein